MLVKVGAFSLVFARESNNTFMNRIALSPSASVSAPSGLSDACCKRIKEDLEMRLRVLNVRGGLAGLAYRRGSEALSRILIDALIIPLCDELGLWLEPEEQLPVARGFNKATMTTFKYNGEHLLV